MAVRIEPHSEPIPGYKLLDRLGAGGFGEVWRAEAPGGIFKAIKIIHGDLRSKDSDLVRYAEQELKSLKRVKQVRHPYLLALDRYDIVDGRLMIVMELADCNLWDRFRECRETGLAGIPRDELLTYMAETAEVLDLFNDQFQLQHLDIKPQNLFLLYNHVKVADFGQVKDLQGLMAAVTGGITPVYAAPETFDGIVTRYCDQYSLACVYQELLTGQRPFDGCSMSQLLMQHINLPPHLEPSPPADRPALARALAKKPDDRWPNVSAFVRALHGGSGKVPAPAARASGAITVPAPAAVGPSDTPAPMAVVETGPVFTPAPPESAGPGPLRPALVIGLGRTGLRVLQRLRFDLTERYGPREATPVVRTLYVDTDADSLDESAKARPAERLAGLDPDDVFPAKLNRAAHYLKPRLNGRSLTDGWFDSQLLYKIPRTPQTMGLRLFGRLAFCDHYRALMGKIQEELDAALTSESLTVTEARTGLSRRTNRPRVYIVAGLGGGTGGGMFLDVAYAVRARLLRLGYEAPEVVGVMVAPPADQSLTSPQALGNSYAALAELNHYSRPESVFSANYDDRHGAVRERAAPFTHFYLVPGVATDSTGAAGWGEPQATPRSRTPLGISPNGSRVLTKPGSRELSGLAVQWVPDKQTTYAAIKPYSDAADLIRLNLFTLVGQAADDARRANPAGPVTFAAYGIAGFAWPRADVVARTTAKLGRAVLRRWASPNARRMREVIPGIAQAKWSQLGLDPDRLLDRLRGAAVAAAGGSIDDFVAHATEPLVPRGWMARLPAPDAVTVAIDAMLKLLGPTATRARRVPTGVERAIADAAAEAVVGFGFGLRAMIPTLVDDPQFRLAGTEDILRQFLAAIDRLLDKHTQAAADLDAKAQAGFEIVSQYAHFRKGMRKPQAAEFAEAIRQFPRARYRAIAARNLVVVYHPVREVLTGLLADVSAARQRLEAAATAPVPMDEATDSLPANRRLMPPGCPDIHKAVDRFLGAITEADLVEIDRRIQAAIEPGFGGVLQACLNSASGHDGVIAAVFEETRAHLEARLGRVDLAAMFADRYRTPQMAERALEQTFQDAEPAWIGSGPWAGSEVAVVGCPAGPGGEPLRELARRAIPVAGLPLADTPDDLTVYREWPAVPLAALPNLGSAAAAAYQLLPDIQQCSAHARLDVTRWSDVDEG